MRHQNTYLFNTNERKGESMRILLLCIHMPKISHTDQTFHLHNDMISCVIEERNGELLQTYFGPALPEAAALKHLPPTSVPMRPSTTVSNVHSMNCLLLFRSLDMATIARMRSACSIRRAGRTISIFTSSTGRSKITSAA